MKITSKTAAILMLAIWLVVLTKSRYTTTSQMGQHLLIDHVRGPGARDRGRRAVCLGA